MYIHPSPGNWRITWADDGSTCDVVINPSGTRLDDPAGHGWDGVNSVFARPDGAGGRRSYAFPDPENVILSATGLYRTGTVEPILPTP